MSAPELRAPGQARPGAHLAPAAGHRVRAALADLFPAPAEPAHRAGLARWAFLLLQVALVALGALVMLDRIPGRPVWKSVYGEDPGVYLPGALAHPWHLLQSYAGYLQLVPRLIGQVAALLPVRSASAAFAVGGALVAAACGLFAHHASAGQVGSRWLRVLLGLSVVLLLGSQWGFWPWEGVWSAVSLFSLCKTLCGDLSVTDRAIRLRSAPRAGADPAAAKG